MGMFLYIDIEISRSERFESIGQKFEFHCWTHLKVGDTILYLMPGVIPTTGKRGTDCFNRQELNDF